MLRSPWWIVAVAWCSCAPLTVSPADAGCNPGTADCACLEDRECGNTLFYFCDTIASRCRPRCGPGAACNGRPGTDALAACEGRLGCWCDEGTCVPALCSDDSACGAQACRDGACIDPPAPSSVARCAITPEFVVLGAGAKVRFEVLSWDAQGKPLVAPGGAQWAALTGAIDGPAAGTSIDFVAGPATSAPVIAVESRFGAVRCQAQVLVLAAPPAGTLLAAVVDEGSGRPIAGATVVVSGPDGAVLSPPETTDGRGVVLVAARPPTTISVFHADYGYQTIANDPRTQGTLFFALRRNPSDRHGGALGTFPNVPLNSNVHLARAGLSSTGDGSLLELTDEAEPTIASDTRVGSQGALDTPVPMGTFLGFGDATLKGSTLSFGTPGVCADEAATSSGTCGTQAAWALGADLPLGDFPGDLYLNGSASLLPVLNRLPRLERFTSSVVRDVELGLQPAPRTASGDPDFLRPSLFTPVAHDFSQLRLGFAFGLEFPPVTKYRGQFLEQGLVTTVALVPGRGLVPLGLGVGTNREPVDAQLDRGVFRGAGQLVVRTAPTHHGLEGQPMAVLSQLISTGWKADASAPRALTTVISPLPELAFDPEGAPLVDQSRERFPAVPEGRFDFGARHFRAEPITGESLLKVTFTDALRSRWDVLVDPGNAEFVLPPVPGTLRDRLFETGNSVAGPRSRLAMKALRYGHQPLLVEQRFVETIEQNPAARPLSALAAWSLAETRALKLTFAWPLLPNLHLAPGPAIELRVEGFRVGTTAQDDGALRLSVEGAACPARVSTTALNGSVTITLPRGCTGPALELHAELLDGQLRPLVPPVEARVPVSIE